jgi:phosphate transport system protein
MEPVAHSRHAYAEEIQKLEHDLLEMGSLAEKMAADAVESLTRMNPEMALDVIQRDDQIDDLDLEIESHCLRLILLQQPAGPDLRMIGTVLKTITDIERVGDLSVDIAKCGLKIEKEFGTVDFVDVPRMAGVARSMLREALEAFVRRDLQMVEHVCAKDDDVDALYRELRGQIHDHMRNKPEEVVASSWLLLAIHHIERIADHAVNIAERVNFMVTGSLKQIATSHKSDSTAP